MHKRILIIEDDAFSANTYKHHLDLNGYETQIASDGRIALDLADSFCPHLIILDLIIPKIDGFTLLKLLKNTKPHSRTPIIVVSNLDQNSDVEKCVNLGANLFITKDSLNYNHLLTQVKKLLDKETSIFISS